MQNKLLIRASALSRLMSEPKSKADKEAGLLGETAKTLITEIWLNNEYGYKEDVVTDEMMKGLICEQDSMSLVQDVLGGEFRLKNTTYFKNEFIHGTPDIILSKEDYCEDIKTSYNLRTFVDAEYKQGNSYWWQGQAYMWLTGKTKYRLMYCLVETPSDITVEQKKRFYYKFNCDETNQNYIDISMQIDHNNNIISKIPKEKRVKIFEFPFDKEAIEKVKTQHAKALNYYNTLKL